MALSVVIDTNVLLVSVSRKSPYYWLFDALRDGQYDLLVTTPIVLEYEEILTAHMGHEVARTVTQILKRATNVHEQQVYYRWGLIQADPDDNKFVDCAISGGADYLVTYDRHFDVLSNLGFPQVTVVTPEAFWDLLGPAS